MTTLYLCGPMTWRPRFNIPEFHVNAAMLRGCGYTVISPPEEDDPDVYTAAFNSLGGNPADLPLSFSLKACATRNHHDVLRSDGVATMGGWESSSGCRHEVALAERLGLPVRTTHEWWSFSQPQLPYVNLRTDGAA